MKSITLSWYPEQQLALVFGVGLFIFFLIGFIAMLCVCIIDRKEEVAYLKRHPRGKIELALMRQTITNKVNQ